MVRERTSSAKCYWCEWPLDLVDHDAEHACDPGDMLERGAAIAFGIVGMFEAIALREQQKYEAIALKHFGGDPYRRSYDMDDGYFGKKPDSDDW